MKKLIIAGLIVVMVFSVFAIAKPNFRPAETNGGSSVVIPAHAVEVAPGVFDLGTREHEGRQVQGYAFVHYKKDFAHKTKHNPGGGGNPNGDGDTSTCFSVLAKGAKWKVSEDYVMDNLFVSETGLGVAEWASNGFTQAGGKVAGSVDESAFGDMNGKNEIMFGNEGLSSNTIAVTITWGVYGGPPQNRRLVEWDMRFNDFDFDFGDVDDADFSGMDYQNIFTHEFGHAIGMGHTSTSSDCIDETMYPYAAEDETKKRTLGDGDIAGVNKLYG